MLLRGQSHNHIRRIERLTASVLFAFLPLVAAALIGYVLHAGFGNDLKPAQAAVGINKMISYQAKMTDGSGVTVQNGTYQLTIRIYGSAAGGDCLYTASGTACGTATSTPVTVTNGIFSILIGDTASQNALTLDFNSDTYYLGVQVGNDSEMTPRKRIGAAGYAINSDTLDGYTTSLTGGSTSFVPVTNSAGDLFLTQRYLSSSTIYISGSGTSTFSQGVTLATAGGNVGIGTSTPATKLHVWDGTLLVDGPANSTLAGSVDTSDYAMNVYVSGKYAYVADYTGLRIIDVANPAAPVIVGSLPTADYTYDVKTVGNYAYVADYRKVAIVDISNPTSPKVVGSYTPPIHAMGIAISGKYAYVADDTQGLDILDISNPASPTRVGFFATTTEMRNVDVQGNYAYVAGGYSGLDIFDVSNPASPKLASEVSTGNFSYRAYVSGKYAYLADGTAGIKIIDISNPASPVTTSTLSVGASIRNIQVAGKYAYLAGANGVYVVDISNPAAPALIGSYPTSAIAYGLHVVGKYAYVANYTSGLAILDLKGADISTAKIGNIETNAMTVTENLDVGRDLYIRNGLGVGAGGIFSQGAFAINVSSTGSGADIFSISASGTTALPYLTVKENGYFGVGTTTPPTTFSVDGSVLFSGNSGATPVSGPGTRMMWIPSKAAFRVGAAGAIGDGEITDGTEWDAANIGNYSFGVGFSSKASGLGAIALGNVTVASGNYSAAFGMGSSATGIGAVAIGYWGGLRPQAMGANSMALGEGAVTEGSSDYAFGYDVNAKGSYSMALGFSVSSTAQYAMTIGRGYGGGENALVNSTENSLAVGFNSTVPTLMVTGGSGAGTYGNVGIGNTAPWELLTIGLGNIALGDGTTTSTIGFATSTYIYAHPARDLAGYSAFTINTTSTLASANLLSIQNNSSNVFRVNPTTSTFSGALAVGTSTASIPAKLSVDGSVLFSGNSGATPVSGPGTRMMWIPAKGAFRAGSVDLISVGDGTEWDDANIGSYSTAFGLLTKANGMASVALNDSTIASGTGSTAIGGQTIASGVHSFASGEFTLASGDVATAMGDYTIASGAMSFAVGYLATAAGNYSVSIGSYTSSTATNSFTIGLGADVVNPLVNSTANSLAVGFNSTVPTLMVTGGSGAGTYGNVGIGNTAPTQRLQVNDAGTATFVVTSAGQVGIGTAGPMNRLSVQGGNISVADGTTTSTLGANFFSIASSTSATLGKFYVDSSGNVSASGTLGATGLATFTGGFISNASSSISSGLQVAGAFNASTTLNVGGAADLRSTLNVVNLSTLLGGFISNASSSIGARLQVAGNLSASSTLGVNNLASLYGGFISNASSSVAAGLQVAGAFNASSTLNVGGVATFNGATSTFAYGATFATTAGGVGIATSSPAASGLTVARGAVLFDGSTGVTPISGAGTRLMWIPSKAAFRAGYVDGAQWDDASIGSYSTAMGAYTTASGYSSIALGNGATANGYSSTAMGRDTIANGLISTALGYSTTASGSGSFAAGDTNVASGATSTAMGQNMTVSGAGSFGINLASTAYTLSTANTMAIVGGKVLIATSTDPVVAAYPAYTSKLFVDTGEAFAGQIIYQQNRANYGLLITNPGFTSNIILSTATSTEEIVSGQGIFNYDVSSNREHRAAKFGINNTGINRQGYTLDLTGVDVKMETANAAMMNNLRGGKFIVRPAGTGAATTTYGLDIQVNPQGSFETWNTYGIKYQNDNQTSASTTLDYGVYSIANANRPSPTPSTYKAYGGYFYAYNASTTYGIYAGVSPGTGNTGWAGWFDGDIYVSNGGTTSTIAGNLAVGGKVTQNCSGACVDIAETFRSSELVESGDVVELDLGPPLNVRGAEGSYNPSQSPLTLRGEEPLVRKTVGGYSDKIVGVVSTNPAITMNGDTTVLGTSGVSETMNPPVALAGRVPVKVTDENGPVKAGDLLVSSSSTPGTAMRYDPDGQMSGVSGQVSGVNGQVSGVKGQVSIIGMALTNFDPVNGQNGLDNVTPLNVRGAGGVINLGKVLVLVQTGRGGLSSRGGESSQSLNVTTDDNSRLISAGDIDMNNKSIWNVKSLAGADDKWGITEDGLFYSKIQTSSGEKKVYATASENPEITLSGSSKLIHGTARIDFDPAYREIFSDTEPIKVFITLTSNEAVGIYVGSKDGNGFTAQETAGGTSSAAFDWYVVAKRKLGGESSQGGLSSPSLTNEPNITAPSQPTPSSTPEIPPAETATTTP